MQHFKKSFSMSKRFILSQHLVSEQISSGNDNILKPQAKIEITKEIQSCLLYLEMERKCRNRLNVLTHRNSSIAKIFLTHFLFLES